MLLLLADDVGDDDDDDILEFSAALEQWSCISRAAQRAAHIRSDKTDVIPAAYVVFVVVYMAYGIVTDIKNASGLCKHRLKYHGA